jgi:hypothetical protein
MAERPDLSTKPRSGVGLDELLGTSMPAEAPRQHWPRLLMHDGVWGDRAMQPSHGRMWPKAQNSAATCCTSGRLDARWWRKSPAAANSE